MANRTILMYGDTGDGKTAQIGEMAEHILLTEGKRTRLYSADRGGWKTIDAQVDLGIIEAFKIPGDYDPWVWTNHAVQGHTPTTDAKGVITGWKKDLDPTIGMYAFESITSISEDVMSWMAQASGRGVNIGGQGAFNFQVGTGTDKMTIGTNNMGHYTVAQQRVLEEVWRSQNLPGTLFWTAAARRAADADSNAPVLGPQVAGKALTSEVPRWFEYTFRISAVPVLNGPTKHVLYLDDHVDQASAMAKGLGNARVPLSGGDVKDGGVVIPPSIEPASIVKALELLGTRQASAKTAIAKRMGEALKKLNRG